MIMSRGIYSLNKWQGIENHYAVWNISKNKSSETECRETLKEFVLEDGIPLIIFGTEKSHRWWLRNGGEAHPCEASLEIATPECKNHYEVTKYDMAADVIAYIASRLASRNTGNDIRVYKRTYEFDLHDVSRGCHESYNSSIPYINLEKLILPFLVIRPIFSGTGGYIKIHSETRFLISPRIFRREEIMRERSNDSLSRGERIHFIFGECPLNEWTRFLNNGATSYVIMAIEEGIIKNVPSVSNPIEQMKKISLNLDGDWKVEVGPSRFEDALSLFNSYYLDPIERLFSDRIVNPWDKLTLEKLKYVIECLQKGSFEKCAKYIQWIEVKSFVENPEKYIDIEEPSKEEKEEYIRKYGKDWMKILLSYMFTEIKANSVTRKLINKEDEEESLHSIVYRGLPGKRLFKDEDVINAVKNPPEGRPALRTKIIERFGWYLYNVYWDEITIRIIRKYKDRNEDIIERLVLKSPDWSEDEIKRYLDELEKRFTIH
jgi:hypothetical protein